MKLKKKTVKSQTCYEDEQDSLDLRTTAGDTDDFDVIQIEMEIGGVAVAVHEHEEISFRKVGVSKDESAGVHVAEIIRSSCHTRILWHRRIHGNHPCRLAADRELICRSIKPRMRTAVHQNGIA